jgi:hypothetical protein
MGLFDIPDDDEQDDLKQRPAIAPPSTGTTAIPPLNLPGVSPQTAQRTSGDQTELNRLADTGSGISQLQRGSPASGAGIAKPHPILGGILRSLDTLGTIVAPKIMSAIPGTSMHHQALENQEIGKVGNDVDQGNKEAQTVEAGARTGQANASAAHEQAETDALKNPQLKPKEEEWSVIPGMVGPKGELVQQEKNSGQIRFAPNISGVGPLKEPNVNEAEKPLANVDQLNQALTRRFQVLNPGKPLPPEYTLPLGAKNGDYTRIDESLKNEESARATKDTHDSAAADRDENRQDRLSRQNEQDAERHQKERDAFVQPLQGAIDNADYQKQYADGKTHTGVGDYQMMLQFQEAIVAGQKAGIRFNTAEQSRIEHAQDLANSLHAKWGHLTGGTYFSDAQRHEIADAMQHVSLIHQQAIARFDRAHGATQGVASGGTTAQPAKALTVDEAKTYLQKAGGDKDKARALAKADGRTF